MSFRGTSMEEYYRERAAEYDAIYKVPDRQDDLVHLRAWLEEQVRGRTVLEIAAGTGHWTEAAATAAKVITATDLVPETLAIARERRLGPHVTYAKADAYALPDFGPGFEVGMAHMWWSHVGRQNRRKFLAHFASRLQPQATLLMIDQNHVDGFCGPVSRLDAWGNQLTLRKLQNGATYEIIKNFPSPEDIRESLAGICRDIDVVWYRHFWAVSARFCEPTVRSIQSGTT
jgi:2-polyprenyl-3-methyl-5-hydroxy-6-metoxy-1,4-benzoquinol methylase